MEAVFPTDPREFDGDDRISFSKLDNKFIAVHDDGNEYEFDADQKRWILTDDEPLEPEPFDTHELLGGHTSQGPQDEGSRKRKNGSGPSSEVSLYFLRSQNHCATLSESSVDQDLSRLTSMH